MPTPEEVLAGHPFFAGLSTEHLDRLASVARPVDVEANRFIFRDGQEATCFLVVYGGDISIELHVPGKGPRIIQTVHAGEVLGWSWLFAPHRWLFDARALNDVHAYCLDAPRLLEAVEDDHEFGFQMMRRFSKMLVDRLNATRMQVLDVYGDR